MKKLLFSIVFSFSCLLVIAQDYGEKNFRLGLTAHPNFGWIKSDIPGIESDGLRAGFTYGLLGDFYFTENYAFSTALKLTTINGQTTLNGAATANKAGIYKLQYIELPAKLKLTTNETNGIKFFGEFGLGNGFNVRAKQDIKGANGIIITENTDIYSETAFYRASLIIGAGGEFKVGEKTAVSAGLTFDNGFTDIKSGDGTLKSSYLGLNLAVFF
jgi:hypothetical protein